MNKLHDSYELKNGVSSQEEEDDFTPDRYRQFYTMFPAKSRTILDIGCNSGRGGAVLKHMDNTLEIFGLDCVQERLNRLPMEYSTKLYGLSSDIPIEDQTFDVVVAGEVLEHLYPSDVDNTLCEIQRVLRIGGRFLMTTPNPHYIKNKIHHKTIYGRYHLTQHFPKSFVVRMAMHGFSNVRTFGSGRVSKYIGCHCPVLSVYGSYMICGDKY
jgi:ubiquinone/menaquinone biosynthesis C-methylase UbiE